MSVLSNAGLPELVAPTTAAYLSTARGLAADPGRLARLRSDLRLRLHGSALMDATRFARDIEYVYETAWQARR